MNLNQSTSEASPSFTLKKALYLASIFFAQFFFVCLISYTKEGSHFLGDWAHTIINFLIADFLGITIFFIPFALIILGYQGLKNKLNLTLLSHQFFFTFILTFLSNSLLINLGIISKEWSGFLPRLFHILVLYFLSDGVNFSFASLSFELMLVLLFSIFTLKSYGVKTSNLFKKIKERKVPSKLGIYLGKYFSLVSKKILRVLQSLKSNLKKRLEKNPGKNLREKKPIFHNPFKGIIEPIKPNYETPSHSNNHSETDTNSTNLEEIEMGQPHARGGHEPMHGANRFEPGETYPSNGNSNEIDFEEHQGNQREEVIDLTEISLFSPKSMDKGMEIQGSMPGSYNGNNSGNNSGNDNENKFEDLSENLSENLFLRQKINKQEINPTNHPNNYYELDKAEQTNHGNNHGATTGLGEDQLGYIRNHGRDYVSPEIKAREARQKNKSSMVINKSIFFEIEKLIADKNELSRKQKTLSEKSDQKKQAEIELNVATLEKTIAEFGIKSQVVDVSVGPTITQYEMTLEPGVKISKIVGLTDNLALSLGAKSVRIVAPIPGKTVIGVEIPNQIQETIYLSEIIENETFQNSKLALPIALGSSITGKGVVTDLTTTPHLLVAGATGSGKSVCINSIICSLLLRLSPYEVRFLMIDPKMVELTIYNGVPHLLAPVITHYEQAALALKWVIKEMTRRYGLLEKQSVRSIKSYNEIIKEKNKIEGKSHLKENTIPYIVVIIDEFADLMMVAKKEIEDSVTRLAAMSRAVGIHLILATQRPSVDVITGIIKANFPSRIAFQVSSKIDSRTILDMSGAEKLLGKGDMLFQSNSSNVLKRIQGTFLADQEVNNVIRKLKQVSYADLPQIDFGAERSKNNPDSPAVDGDELFQRALEIALKEKKISTSYIQRKLKIGYNRAARIVEQMEAEGIVSSANGVKPRELILKD